MYHVGKVLFFLCLFLLVALLINRVCTCTHTSRMMSKQTIHN